jgi:hypothetical protein
VNVPGDEPRIQVVDLAGDTLHFASADSLHGIDGIEILAPADSTASVSLGKIRVFNPNPMRAMWLSALCPGPVDTEFNDVAGCEFGVSAISAEECAKEGIEGLFRRKLIIIPGKGMKAAASLSKLAPRELILRTAGELQKQKLK